MSKPVDDTVDERRPLPRLYAHYHRLLINLLENLVEDARVVWLTGEKGHIRRSERGFDAGKLVKGRKRHLLVDTLGLVLTVFVSSADL